MMEFLFFNLSVGFIFIILKGIRKKFQPNKLNILALTYQIICYSLVLYYSLKSEWSLKSFFNLFSLLDYFAELLFIFPLVSGFILLTIPFDIIIKEERRNRSREEDNNNMKTKQIRLKRPNYLIIHNYSLVIIVYFFINPCHCN
ncbi:MAG: hypothetical protein ACTSO2_02550 [Promethearchaeota archaeon]